MATWIAHLRIADRLLEYGFQLERIPFLAGNIAPDVTAISKKISHFVDDYGYFQPEDFYATYLHGKSYDSETYAFLMGWYLHLLADVEWSGNVWRPFKKEMPELAHRMETDFPFAHAFKRKEWFGHDFLYLHANPDYESWKLVREIESLPDCPGIISGDDLLHWFQTDVATTSVEPELLDFLQSYDFPYLSKLDLQTWLDCTIGVMIEMLKGKGVECPNPTPLWGAYIQPYA